MITIPVYSEQELTPRASQVIRAIVDEFYPGQDIKFKPWGRVERRVLVFGAAPADSTGVELVYTYSIAQIMSKANAGTVLAAGIRQFLTEPEPIPFKEPVRVWNFEDIQALLDPKKPVAIDIETDGNLGKTHTPEEVRILSVAFYQPGHAPMVVAAGGGARLSGPELGEFIGTFEKAIYHNGKFDTRVMNRVFKRRFNVWFDTMLAHHVLNHAAGDHKLKTLARRYLGAPEWEADLSQWTKGGGHYENIPVDRLVEYNGWDVYWTYKLYEFLEAQIMADENYISNLVLELQYADFLLDVETYGIPFDIDYSVQFAAVKAQEMEAAKTLLAGITKDPGFNPGSWQQVKKFLESRGYIVPSTNEENILYIQKGAGLLGDTLTVDFCIALLQYRKASKIKGTYAEGWANHYRNGRVHPTFLVHGTTTGRLSSTGPNAQNVPRDKEIRKLVRTNS